MPGGAVAWSSDQSHLYTITADSEGGDNPVLHILANPELATTTLNATTPASAVPGQQFAVSGTLASGWGAWDAGTTVSVSRDGTVLDAAVPVNGDGSYSFADTLPTAAGGTVYHYAVSYAGDAKHAAAQASAQISEPAPLSPSAHISPVGGSQSLTVLADTGSSTDSATITSRTIDFGDGTGPEDISTPEKTTHTYEFPGTYQVKLTEGDAAGRHASVTYPVTVGLTASARMNLIARDAAGALWQYEGTGISTRVFEPRAEIGTGWNTYKMLTSLAGLRADGTGDLVARDASGVLWLYQGTGGSAAPFKPRVRIGGGWNAYNSLVGTGDLTGDGHADLVARDASGVLWLYQGTGGSAVPFKSRVRIGGGWNAYNTLA